MNTPLINASAIHWHIGEQEILHNISLQLHPGEVLGIIGPNGAGKSSLLNILARITEPGQGSLELSGRSYQTIERRNFAQQLTYLEQQAIVNWPLLVEKVIQLGRSPYQSTHGKLNDQDKKAITKALDATGIKRLLGRNMTTLSQGEKMLVALARVFATEPKVILADEPVAALDPYHQLLIMELLQAHSHRQQGHGCIIVLHDLSLAARFCDRLALMSEGKIVCVDTPEKVLSDDNLREFYKILCYSDFEQAVIQPLQRY